MASLCWRWVATLLMAGLLAASPGLAADAPLTDQEALLLAVSDNAGLVSVGGRERGSQQRAGAVDSQLVSDMTTAETAVAAATTAITESSTPTAVPATPTTAASSPTTAAPISIVTDSLATIIASSAGDISPSDSGSSAAPTDTTSSLATTVSSAGSSAPAVTAAAVSDRAEAGTSTVAARPGDAPTAAPLASRVDAPTPPPMGDVTTVDDDAGAATVTSAAGDADSAVTSDAKAPPVWLADPADGEVPLRLAGQPHTLGTVTLTTVTPLPPLPTGGTTAVADDVTTVASAAVDAVDTVAGGTGSGVEAPDDELPLDLAGQPHQSDHAASTTVTPLRPLPTLSRHRGEPGLAPAEDKPSSRRTGVPDLEMLENPSKPRKGVSAAGGGSAAQTTRPGDGVGGDSAQTATGGSTIEDPASAAEPAGTQDSAGAAVSHATDVSSPAPKATSGTPSVAVVGLMFLACFLVVAGFFVFRKIRDSWYRRHYRKMDFLVDGMYNL